jgi:trigger factor
MKLIFPNCLLAALALQISSTSWIPSASVVSAFQWGVDSRRICGGPRRQPLHRRVTFLSLSSTTDDEVKVQRLPDSAVIVDIPVPGSATKAAYDKVCTELSKTIQIPGFRKGSRIPPQVLEQTMAAKGGRNAIKVQAINELILQLVEPTLKSKSLDPIGQPTLQTPAETLAESFVAGQDMTLSVRVDVWPEIQWTKPVDDAANKPYVGLTGSYSRKPFNQAKLDKAVNDLRERYATLAPIADQSHVLAMGDACIVNMVGYMATPTGEKGDPLPAAASGDRVEVILGTGRYMAGLVEGLVGAKVGDTVTVNVAFPQVRRKVACLRWSCDCF